LSQLSKLNSIDFREGKEWQTRGWTIPNFWVPVGYLEPNVWNVFVNRYRKLIRGKHQINQTVQFYGESNDPAMLTNPDINICLRKADASNLSKIPNGFVDYIFTDPPYGSSIPYFGLSAFWGNWLKMDLPYAKEIIISEKKNKTEELKQYKFILGKSFAELFRILKPGKYMTITFHNRYIGVWNALVSSAIEAGFVYENDVYQLPAIVSAKAQLHKSGSMTGDIYVDFIKPKGAKHTALRNENDAAEILIEEAKEIVASRGGIATTDQLMRGIASRLIKMSKFSELEDRIETILKDQFIEVSPNIWREKEDDKYKVLKYVPLNRRIKYIIEGVLERERKSEYDLNSFLLPIFTHLRNGKTPEGREIIEVLHEYAEEKNGKWTPINRPQIELFKKEDEGAEGETEESISDHNAFIYKLAKLGLSLGYKVWVGKNEQNIESKLQELSIVRLEIPGISDKTIAKDRIDQIDVIWLDVDNSKYKIFEVENSTRVSNCIPRIANFTRSVVVKIPVYIIIPDNLIRTVKSALNSRSSRVLIDGNEELWRYLTYSNFLHGLERIQSGSSNGETILNEIAEDPFA